MTIRSKYYSEKANRRKVAVNEKNRKVIKAIVYNQLLPKEIREAAFINLSNRARKEIPERLKNRCIYTNRSKGVIRLFKSSRIAFRLRVRSGQLLGLRKAVW